MLDDLKIIHQRDPSDALGVAEKQAAQYEHNFGFNWTPDVPVKEVMVAGMGGSGLAARAYRTIPGLHVPFEIIQDYELPDWTSAHTLLVCSSYSGNTEEVVSVLQSALDSKRPYERPMIVVVASGGTLLKIAQANGLPCITLPKDYQPRYTFGFQYRALAEIFQASGLHDNFLPILEQAAADLPAQIAHYVPTVATTHNQAKQIALECMGKSVVVYASTVFEPAAYKWKISFNENAKHIAWCGTYPEFNHNEFLGWSEQPEYKPYMLINLSSDLDHPRIGKRYEVSERLLSGRKPAAYAVTATGETRLAQMLQLIALGDYVSMYLAILANIDPTPVDLVEKLKVKMME